MDPVLIISMAAFVGAAVLAIAITNLAQSMGATRAEDRLEVLAGLRQIDGEANRSIMKEDMVKLGRGAVGGVLGSVSEYLGSWSLFFEQADSPISFEKFLMVSAGCGVLGVAGAAIARLPAPMYPVMGLILSFGPLGWLWWRRRGRFKSFGKQLPDALELIARALRSGHSLNSGLHLVTEEMPQPIAYEFSLAYEQQNLGIPIEQALKGMLTRMPNLDLKFFVTAVAIQRQTGGDLAEILDKIGHVVRERFKILGMVQALTGEGRLSGVVLMAMPICIFLAVFSINPDYVMLLFTTDLGKKMVAVGIVMQILGAIVINKIIDIKV
jgi:tight adherence protein B